LGDDCDSLNNVAFFESCCHDFPFNQAANDNVYVTLNVSPDTTARSPGALKSAAEYNVPVVPLLVLLLVKNAPPTVVVPLMLNVAGEAELVATEGLAVVGVPNVQAGRVAWL